MDRMTYPTGVTMTLTCDTANRVKTISAGGATPVRDVTYDPAGKVTRMTYGNGVVTTISFDDRGRLKSANAPGVMDLALSYDGADNVRSLEDRVIAGSARTMTYDALDRLATAVAQQLWGTASYEYDKLGNRTRKQMGGDVLYTYDSSNRLAGFSERPARGTVTFTWDEEGRLASSSDGSSYRYDGQGRRVLKSDAVLSTVYHYDPAGHVIAETRPDTTWFRNYDPY